MYDYIPNDYGRGYHKPDTGKVFVAQGYRIFRVHEERYIQRDI
jgi:hypothetical protein